MLRIANIKINIDSNQENIIRKAAKTLGVWPQDIKKYKIIKKSVDARKKMDICFVYTVDVTVENEDNYVHLKNVEKAPDENYEVKKHNPPIKRPVVIGAGPAGIFAALILSEAGLMPIVIEQGKDVTRRKADVDLFWETGKLNTISNVQFGEGGAGAFSDGKLTTGTSDSRINKVLHEFVLAGAPEDIAYSAKPHIGTDKLMDVLKNLRKKITSLGGEYRFSSELKNILTENNQLTGLEIFDAGKGEMFSIETDFCILAIGHSARDTFEMLEQRGVAMEAKAFSVGVRIEHAQSLLDWAQYGKFAGNKNLGAADYKLNCRANDRGIYTFCMCPGGRVIAASSESGGVATNGMSNYARDLENANSALLVGVNPSDFTGKSPLRGIDFQRELERKAFELGGSNYFAPVQLVGDFLKDRKTTSLGNVNPTYIPGVTLCDLRDCLPEFIASALKPAIIQMGQKIHGFDIHDAVLTAVESRSSSPVRIIRNEKLCSNIAGLIPCGEGAGYAGGIMSAAVDGVKCAEIK